MSMLRSVNFSWGEDYFNLTQESETKGGEDYTFTSEWDCEKTTQYNLIAVYKPFGDRDVKVWDMKLAVRVSFYLFVFLFFYFYLILLHVCTHCHKNFLNVLVLLFLLALEALALEACHSMYIANSVESRKHNSH